MKTVVAYYSRTGHTKFVSDLIAQQLGADLCEIIDKKNRDGKIGFIGGGSDALREKLTEIEVSKSVEGYDLIIIGTPVWAGKISPAIRKFLVTNDLKEKTVALFVTLDGNKPEKTLENMKATITAKTILAKTGFIRPMGNLEKTQRQVKTWCEEIQKANPTNIELY